MANFASILDKPSADAERPKPLPQGSYICVVQGLPRFDKSSKKQTDFAEFKLQPLQAQDDVDADDLEAMGGLVNKTIKATFYLTEASEYRLKEFLTDCGIPEEEDGEKLTHRQRIEMSPGTQVGAFIKHTASEDGSAVYANFDRSFVIE